MSAEARVEETRGIAPQRLLALHILNMADNYTKSELPSSHHCHHCSKFIVYLFDKIPERRVEKSTWHQPNPSQDRLASRLYGDDPKTREWSFECREFYRTTNGISFFDTCLEDLKSAIECALSRHLVRCLTKDDDIPKRYAIGVDITTSYSLEFGIYDLDQQRWESLLGPEDDVEPDNTYTIMASPDSPAARIIENRPINHNPGTDAALRDAKQWLNECMQDHGACRKPDKMYTPTRLVEIFEENGQTAYRILNMSCFQPYAALSYCWGGDQTFKTTMETIRIYSKKISVNLPQTLLDAIYVTRHLGLRYIWIDALCIIQDSNEDRAFEIGQMAKVYSNATITIAATRAAAVWQGFLSERPPIRLPDRHFSLPAQRNSDNMGEITLVPSTHEGVDPLDLRGWCYQERVLSPRLIDFGTLRTQYTCQDSTSHSDGWSALPVERAYGAYLNSEIVTDLIAGNYAPEDMQLHWLQVVQGFTTRGLSFISDKLPAIAGMAESFGALVHDQYCAGLWSSGMPVGLLWSVSSAEIKPRLSSENITAPSWSWAAVADAVRFDPLHTRRGGDVVFDVEVQRCDVELLDARAPYGLVKEGRLTLSAHARRAQWTRWSRYGPVDILLASEDCSLEDSEGLGLSFSVGSSMGLGFKPDAVEEEFLENPMSTIHVHLLLLGTIDPSLESGIFPSIFGMVVMDATGREGFFSRVGLFERTLPRQEFNKYWSWFMKGKRQTVVLI
ncbi:Nn.00g029460.m01.CDS01 [Neocucurbitaria sp. VM-36]